MRNFTLPTGTARTATVLRPENLTPGRILIRAEFAQWGDSPVRLGRYVVERVTKTRVIIRHESHEPGKHDVRLLVDRYGDVSTRCEGGSKYHSFDNYNLMTEDDEEVQRISARNARLDVKRDALLHVTGASKSLTRATATAAIEALQKYLDATD